MVWTGLAMSPAVTSAWRGDRHGLGPPAVVRSAAQLEPPWLALYSPTERALSPFHVVPTQRTRPMAAYAPPSQLHSGILSTPNCKRRPRRLYLADLQRKRRSPVRQPAKNPMLRR